LPDLLERGQNGGSDVWFGNSGSSRRDGFYLSPDESKEQNPKNRAADLERGLRELLNDPDGYSLIKEVYDHGMIRGLFKGE